MPYIKKKEPPFAKMGRLITGYGLNAPRLAELLDVSRQTAKRRLENPETLTLQDLDRINRLGHVPIEEIRDAIQR